MDLDKKNIETLFIGGCIGAILVGILLWCSFYIISPGHVGVVVNLIGNEKGVEDKELTVGLHFIAPWKRVYDFPTFEQNHMWDGKKTFMFQTSEGLNVTADVGITYHLNPTEIHILFAKYRRGMNEITDIFIRNFTRDAINRCASKMKIEDLYGKGKESFFDHVQQIVRDDLKLYGIEISRIYLIGNFHFPDSVVQALNAKISAIQRAEQRENELREAEAEAKKKIAEANGQAQCMVLRSKAEAEANAVISNSISKELIQWEAVRKWDGKMPKVVGSEAGLMIPMELGKED